MAFTIDVDENKWSRKVIEALLQDKATGRNIIWATNSYYKEYGDQYQESFCIEYDQITGANAGVIKPRIFKSKEHQGTRTREKAEVFTVSWLCNSQINLVDSKWFGRDNVFNTEGVKSWTPNPEKIAFPTVDGKTWQDYVKSLRLEITCGEAPYIVSRYDTVSGNIIELSNRIGMLDRKIRVVNENTSTEEEWFHWVEQAFKSIYGYEFQGDSLLLARENLLASFCDYVEARFQREPTEQELLHYADIIAWNIWQMDAFENAVPFVTQEKAVDNLFDFFTEALEDDLEQEPVLCKIMDWEKNEPIFFKDLFDGAELMTNKSRKNKKKKEKAKAKGKPLA